MSKGLLFCARPISGFDGIRMLDHLRIIETECSSIDLLTSTKTEKSKEIIFQYSGLQINNTVQKITNDYTDLYSKMDSWSTVWSELNVDRLKNYDKFFLMGSFCSRSNGFMRGGKSTDKFPILAGKQQLTFISHAKPIVNILALLKAHILFDIPLHEYAYDSCELALNNFHPNTRPTKNYNLYYGYTVNEYGAKRLDCTQYYLNKKEQIGLFEEDFDKTIDFIGGYTTTKKDNRNVYSSEMNQFASQLKNSKIYIKEIGSDTGEYLSVTDYNNMLKRSKYTMVFPAYDTNVISIDRTIGALNADCLPIFHSSCKLEPVEKSFNVKLKDLQTIEIPSENYRLEKLEYLKDKILKYRIGFNNGKN